MIRQQFSLDGEPVEVEIGRMVNAGYAGSNQLTVRAHIEELAAIGVSVPARVPTFYPIPVNQLTTASEIQVTHGKTSAEVEYVYIVSAGRRYITVGSDHTDRELEAHSVSKSKQVYPNIIASEVWEYESVKDHLDQLLLTCDVYENGEWRLYQRDAVTALLSPETLLELGSQAIGDAVEGLVLYSGTIPTIGTICYASRWRVSITDQKLGKQITTEYAVEQLPAPIE